MTWPYPGDTPTTAARRVAWAYRQRLHTVAPTECEQVDTVMRKLGQHWAIPRPAPINPDAWLTATEAAEYAAVRVATIAYLRRTGRLTGRQISPARWEYQVREITALATAPRTRRNRNHQPHNATKRES